MFLDVEEEVKVEILNAQCATAEPKIIKLFKVMNWMEKKLSEEVKFPQFADISNLQNANNNHQIALEEEEDESEEYIMEED